MKLQTLEHYRTPLGGFDHRSYLEDAIEDVKANPPKETFGEFVNRLESEGKVPSWMRVRSVSPDSPSPIASE